MLEKIIRGQCSIANTRKLKTHTFFRRFVLENLFKRFQPCAWFRGRAKKPETFFYVFLFHNKQGTHIIIIIICVMFTYSQEFSIYNYVVLSMRAGTMPSGVLFFVVTSDRFFAHLNKDFFGTSIITFFMCSLKGI